jgi:hypothetical protein
VPFDALIAGSFSAQVAEHLRRHAAKRRVRL